MGEEIPLCMVDSISCIHTNTHTTPHTHMHTCTHTHTHTLDLIEVLGRVLVTHVSWTDVQFEVWSKILKIVVVRQLCTYGERERRHVWGEGEGGGERERRERDGGERE